MRYAPFRGSILALWAAGSALAASNGSMSTLDTDKTSTSKPNIVFILTDDQDLQMNSMEYMSGVKSHLVDQGTTFAHHFATVSLCCPSRVNMWTGKAAHNTNVTDLAPPYGGYPKFVHEGYYDKWLPIWLKEAGYQTYYTGKLMNGHTSDNYRDKLQELGLDGHDFQIEPGTYQYLNTTLQHNLEDPKNYPGLYATDLLANRSLAWIDQAATSDSPFFLAINPVNPHNNLNYTSHSWTPPVPAPRHENDFPNATVPRNKAFNPDQPSGASWVKHIPLLSNDTVTQYDHYYRRRLQALQSVDDLVNATMAKLEEHNMLDNTYIFYTSDNGFHIGQHRLAPGKRCPYEEDVSVPFVVRGPGVPKNATVDWVTSHTDVAPTLVELAGAQGPGDFDGVPMPLDGTGSDSAAAAGMDQKNDGKKAWEHVGIEHWGEADMKTDYLNSSTVNTYKAVRVIGDGYSLYYAVWCDGDHELYDMSTDSAQMNNLATSNSTLLSRPIPNLLDRLDALTLVLKTCKGESCYDPWGALDPSGATTTLRDALDPKYDSFYAKQNKVGWDQCAAGYIKENEGPIDYMTFGNHSNEVERRAEALRNWALFTD